MNCTCPPGFTWGKLGEIVSLVAAVMVTVAFADWLGAATDVAVMVTVGGAGTLAGAVYKPEAEMDPHAEPEQPVPATVQFTDVFVLPVTVAENCFCPPALTWTVDGDTDTDTDAAASISTVAEADFVGSATEVALTVACGGLGTAAGAVYRPLALIVPHDPATHPTPDTVQVTAVLEVPVTLAANCCFPLFATVTSVGETVTPTVAAVPMVTVALPD